MQVENLTRLPLLPSPAVAELHRLLARLRWRLGCERVAHAAIRGILASAVALIALSLALWLTAIDRTWLWLAVAPLLASLTYALLRWPSPLETARVADRRLGLDERLATAFELSQAVPSGRFDLVQIRDAVARATTLRPAGSRTWLALTSRTRTEGVIAGAAVVLAGVTVLLLSTIPRPLTSLAGPSADQSSLTDDSAAADTSADRAALADDALAGQAAAAAPRATASTPPTDLAARVQQEQAERAALDLLAQGLGSVSAGQGAADAIQRGDFGAARNQIQSLGEEADQVSDAAKQQLARGLQQAAAASTQSDRALADREQQAAQSLSRSTYADQRQALNALADQVQRSGSRSVPADQLEREQGQLQLQQQSAQQQQQQQSAQQQQQSAQQPQQAAQQQGGQQSSAQGGPAARNQQSSAGPRGTAAAAAGATAEQGAPPNATSGGLSDANNGGAQQGGAGIGSGSAPDPFSNQASRLDSSGQQVQVPTRLSNGAGVRPADGTEDQSTANPLVGGQSVAEQAQAQQTGQVNPEQNLVPGEQRPVVRGYFR